MRVSSIPRVWLYSLLGPFFCSSTLPSDSWNDIVSFLSVDALCRLMLACCWNQDFFHCMPKILRLPTRVDLDQSLPFASLFQNVAELRCFYRFTAGRNVVFPPRLRKLHVLMHPQANCVTSVFSLCAPLYPRFSSFSFGSRSRHWILYVHAQPSAGHNRGACSW